MAPAWPGYQVIPEGRRDTSADKQAALLVAVILDGQSRETCEEHLDELALLAETAGYEVRDRVIQERARPDAATLLGRGKVEEVARQVRDLGVTRVVTDDDLTPQQGAQLEKHLGVSVSDRSGLILEIFASRARTREARTQVELAALRYTLPRLSRRWTHLSRQVGGIGVRGGVGERQIELDRRIIRRRITRLERDLDRITRRRVLRRRRGRNVFTAALVGYTNSGKSTLFNRLTDASSRIEDRLFATLDPVRRRIVDSDGEVVLTDTVGFIRKLPHHLITSFRSTLEEVGEADLLIQVIDISDPHLQEKMITTDGVLRDLHLADHRRLLVFNKTDALEDEAGRVRQKRCFPGAIFVSALTGEGLPGLLEQIRAERARTEVETEVEIASEDTTALSLLHRQGRVVEMTGEDGRLRVKVRTSPAGASRIRRQLGPGGQRAHA